MANLKNPTRRKSKKSTDGMELLRDRFVKGDAEMRRMVGQEKMNMEIARKIHDLRTDAGLSQRELAQRVGTTASVICRLEDADYDGHSLSMLARIAAALEQRLDVRFLPARTKSRSA